MKKTDPYYSMTIIGGILGGYAVAGFQGMFASAQTANLIALVELLVGKNLTDALFRVGSFLAFGAGIVLSEYIRLRKDWSLEKIAVLIDMIVAFWLAFGILPKNTVASLYPIWFAAAFQWNVFEGTEGYVSSCIFSTNNVKQMLLSGVRYICSKEDKEKERMLYFGKVLLCFHIGVLAVFLCYSFVGRMAILLLVLPGIETFWCLSDQLDREKEEFVVKSI